MFTAVNPGAAMTRRLVRFAIFLLFGMTVTVAGNLWLALETRELVKVPLMLLLIVVLLVFLWKRS